MPPMMQAKLVRSRRQVVDGLLCGLAAVGAVAVAVHARRTTVDQAELAVVDARPATASLRINPNTASWVELSALPGLGEVLSKRIVAYREKRRVEFRNPTATVFRRADDLEAVKGIGPKRSASLAQHMTFLLADNQEPDSRH